jgi:hypothetical protein
MSLSLAAGEVVFAVSRNLVHRRLVAGTAERLQPVHVGKVRRES